MQSVLNLNVFLVRESFDLKALPYPFQATEFEFRCVNETQQKMLFRVNLAKPVQWLRHTYCTLSKTQFLGLGYAKTDISSGNSKSILDVHYTVSIVYI